MGLNEWIAEFAIKEYTEHDIQSTKKLRFFRIDCSLYNVDVVHTVLIYAASQQTTRSGFWVLDPRELT